MDELNSKTEFIDRICLSEGASFECDKKAILDEYQILESNESSISIKILSIFGGLLASLVFIGFLAIVGLYNSESACVLFGIAFIISAVWLNINYDKLIIDTFSISSYFIGFVLLIYGLLELEVNVNIVLVLISVIALISMSINQNYILAFISVLIISGGFIDLIIFNDINNFVHIYIAVNSIVLTYLYLNEAKIISSNRKFSKLYYPVRIASVISFLFGFVSIGKIHLIPISYDYIWVSSIVMILIIMYIIYNILKINEINNANSKILIYVLSSLILVSTVFSPAISGAIIIILLSFLVNYKTGLVIGIVSIIYFISQFYYDLNFTLLTKSIILFSSGIVFLLLYLLIPKNQSSNEKI